MKKQIQLWVRGVSVVVLAVMLLLAGCRASTDISKPAADKAAAPALVVATPNPVASSPGGLPQEGVQVHGHWTIEVRNPDGTLAEVREFENALLSYGSMALVQVLGRTRSVGGWEIMLSGNTSDNSAFQTGVGARNGFIVESGGLNVMSGAGFFPTLTIAVTSEGLGSDKLELQGTATAQFNGNIGVVRTMLNTLPNTVAPSSTYGSQDTFTRTNLVTPINLLAGQQVLVRVVITFS